MLKKIASRWWIILLLVVVCVAAAGVSNYRQKPLYVGRTTLLVSLADGSKVDKRVSMKTVAQVALSQRTMVQAATSLRDYGVSKAPQEVLGWTSIHPVNDANVLAVEVTLPDQTEAKVGADIVAASVKKVCQEVLAPKQKDEPVLMTIDPAVAVPVDQHRVQKLQLAFVGGLLLGVILAAVIPISRERAQRFAVST